jgi:cob(I)alamin adenosyltransferase
MKIYTKAGDDGSTGLIGGQRIRKSDARIDCVGAVDEVNASLGWCTVCAEASQASQASQLQKIQNDLFVIGSHLALADGATTGASLPALDESIVSRLEMEIDAADRNVAPLRNFILPGGTEMAARLHLARTVCRRAERRVVAFAMDRPVPTVIVTYLNRLSDWLFVQARLANHRAGVADIPWVK